jgi:lipopolysaccharide export LptBFGC system permease protein LptF
MENNSSAYKSRNHMRVLLPIVGIGIVLTVVTFALAIVILVKVNKGFDEKQGDSIPATTSSTSSTPPSTNAFSTTINPTTTLTNQLVTTSTNQPVTTSTNQAATTSQP